MKKEEYNWVQVSHDRALCWVLFTTVNVKFHQSDFWDMAF